MDLTTIHQAKGLEWPLVFVPALTSRRFYAGRGNGRAPTWLVPDSLFDRARYEGSVDDERRLFYVAMTRARDFLSLSCFDRIKQSQRPSPFLEYVAGGVIWARVAVPDLPAPVRGQADEELLELTFSDLALYRECGRTYRLRRLVGFQPTLAPELGYGKAVHHVLRRVADHFRGYRRKPTPKELDRLFDDEFYLPAANPTGYQQLRASAKRLVDRYLDEWESDLHRTWAVERPFELHLPKAIVSGRADVIVDEGTDGTERLSIVDYKTAADGHDSHSFQLQVYTDAGRREGLVVDGAFVHDLRQAARHSVSIDSGSVRTAEDLVNDLVAQLRARRFPAVPGAACQRCDVRTICRDRAG